MTHLKTSLTLIRAWFSHLHSKYIYTKLTLFILDSSVGLHRDTARPFIIIFKQGAHISKEFFNGAQILIHPVSLQEETETKLTLFILDSSISFELFSLELQIWSSLVDPV
jgi:hypothetical protein